jgi:hypothetical protein
MSDCREHLQKNLGAGCVLTSELGGGAVAPLFLPEEISLGPHVVVKVLDPELAPGLTHGRQFATGRKCKLCFANSRRRSELQTRCRKNPRRNRSPIGCFAS